MGGAASQEDDARLAAGRRAVALVRSGDAQALRSLVARQQLDVNALVTDGYDIRVALLYHAVGSKQHDTIQLLLELGAHPDVGIENGWAPLHEAVKKDDERAVALLLEHGADANAVDERGGQTPLFKVKSAQVAQLLIDAGADVHYLNDKDGRFVLAQAIYGVAHHNSPKYWEVVEALLRHGADIDHVKADGQGALHLAARQWLRHEGIKRLLASGADPSGRNKRGETPLHEAVTQGWSEGGVCVVESLLAAGSDANAQDNDGQQPLHGALRAAYERRQQEWTPSYSTRFQRTIASATMRCLQLLIFNGAKWDARCEERLALVASLQHEASSNSVVSLDIARAVRLCIDRWMAEYTMKLPPTNVPIEEVNNGFEAVKTYLDHLALSKHVVLRRKICVVGPSNWGKTSLVKSLVSDEPSLVHPDDRTIGIDKFKLAFDQNVSTAESVVHHEVTFWDFAGQDEYQVAHSLLFSRRTLYLVCIDLGAYAAAYLKAEMITRGNAMALNERMNAFVESRILRWIRLILARQPDAEFEFVGTKKDLAQTVDADAHADLEARLANVLVITRAIVAGKKGGMSHLSDRRLDKVSVKPEARVTLVSCTQSESVDEARSQIISLICTSERSYAMPDSYSEVLRIIKEKRRASQESQLKSRIDQCFVKVNTLTSELAQAVKGINRSTGRVILKALRDIGDVLWYEDVDDETLRETVVLDPLLLIDLIRQIFNHKQKSEVLYHADLKQLEVWSVVCEDEKLVLAMKRLLHKFQLAHPTDTDTKMQWDSDLMLPASWRSKTSAQLMFMGQPLNHPYGVSQPRAWQCDVHWEIEIDSGFQEALFDRLVVATYEPAFTPRRVGPDYILYGDASSADSAYACRLIVDWHRTTHKRVLHLEAVLAEDEVDGRESASAGALWARFECVCEGLAAVLELFPGLRVSTQARLGGDDKPQLRTCTTVAAKWLPPEPTLTKCRELLTSFRTTE